MSAEQQQLVAFELTHVRYVENDTLGLLLALVTLTPVFVMVMYATLIVNRRDFQTCFICAGQLGNVALNLLLKKVISQPRPKESGFEDGGMPSNHSQFICFFSTLYILQIWRINTEVLGLPFKILYSVALVVLACGVCYSRYYLHYHFADQIYVGAACGVIVGLVWHQAYMIACASSGSRSYNLSDKICSHHFMKWMGLRDYSHIEYAPLQEYKMMESSKKGR